MDTYEKKYNEALEKARYVLHTVETAGCVMHKDLLTEIFPELAESEDERIRKEIISIVKEYGRICEKEGDPCGTIGDCLAYLEKQKESLHVPESCKENPDSFTDEHPNIIYTEMGEEFAKQKEQKPNSTEDMPYVTDEHFFEREQADSFKYRLAEYMTKNCKKEESPYGYTYKINSETILEMAKEELIKRGELQKPVEWSEEDEKIIQSLIREIDKYVFFAGIEANKIVNFLKSLRPSWKPSEEQMEALEYVIRDYREDGCNATANYLQEILDHLKNM